MRIIILTEVINSAENKGYFAKYLLPDDGTGGNVPKPTSSAPNPSAPGPEWDSNCNQNTN